MACEVRPALYGLLWPELPPWQLSLILGGDGLKDIPRGNRRITGGASRDHRRMRKAAS